MKEDNNDELVVRVREAGGKYSLNEILDYAQRLGVSPEVLEQMSGAGIIKMVDDYLDEVYGTRIR